MFGVISKYHNIRKDCFKKYLLKVFLPFFLASFYGSGYANLKLQDARSTTDLSLKFRTAKSGEHLESTF